MSDVFVGLQPEKMSRPIPVLRSGPMIGYNFEPPRCRRVQEQPRAKKKKTKMDGGKSLTCGVKRTCERWEGVAVRERN